MIRSGLPSGSNPAYQFYDHEGEEIIYNHVLDQLTEADVVLFGEQHDHAVVHLLQYEMTRDLFRTRNGNLILGAEMFEADNQLILNEYLSGIIKHEHLVTEAKIWDNYDTDYRPLVEFAKEHGLRFIATNIPRRYANLVARKGTEALESLSEEAKRYMAPLPIKVDLATPGYRDMIEVGIGHGAHMNAENFVAAQAVKDATMAHFIMRYFVKGNLFIHYHGDYHSKNYGGIYWYLKQSVPELHVLTISSVENQDLEFKEEYKGLGDYVLLVLRHE
jgi:uncharacterized iron-regulated protein